MNNNNDKADGSVTTGRDTERERSGGVRSSTSVAGRSQTRSAAINKQAWAGVDATSACAGGWLARPHCYWPVGHWVSPSLLCKCVPGSLAGLAGRGYMRRQPTCAPKKFRDTLMSRPPSKDCPPFFWPAAQGVQREVTAPQPAGATAGSLEADTTNRPTPSHTRTAVV